MSLTIEYVKDKEGNRFYPVTQEKGVFDENGVRLDTKLNQKESTSHKVTSISASSTDVEYPSARAVYRALQGGVIPGDAYIKPETGIPKSDLAADVRQSLDNADSAYQKPNGGIPASDLASGVIPAAQVNSDWNAASGVAQILNKPDLTKFPKYELCEDLAEYQDIQNPQSDTFYCIPEEEPLK